MSKGRARIVVRLTDDEMRMVQAAADVIQVDIKKLARLGVLREVQDIRNRLIEQLKQEKEARDKVTREAESSAAVSPGESPGIPGAALDGSPKVGDYSGSQSQS